MERINVHNAAEVEEFLKVIRNRAKFKVFLLRQLPAAFFSGLQVLEIDTQMCRVSVPFKWFTQNPFRSTYFACLSMAAEMTTGVLAMAHIHRRKPSISMLITANSALFHKKATGITIFTCADGEAIQAAIQDAVETGTGQSFTARSVGHNVNGDLVAEFHFTWSFKVKATAR